MMLGNGRIGGAREEAVSSPHQGSPEISAALMIRIRPLIQRGRGGIQRGRGGIHVRDAHSGEKPLAHIAHRW